MVTLDTFILHLENLKEYYGTGNINVTVAVDDPENESVSFIPIEELKDINIYKLKIDGVEHHTVYIDVCQLLTEAEPE